MAQRTIHYLMGELIRDGGIGDMDRFRVGNVLPDAYGEGATRRGTHFIVDAEDPVTGASFQYCDYEGFRRQFEAEVSSDGLYLGYYLHLFEDACFRVFWKSRGLQPRIRCRADVETLHRDYHLLNAYIVGNYGIRNELVFPHGFEGERIHRLGPFWLEKFMDEFSADFTERPTGSPVFLTGQMLDEFIAEYVPLCKEALARVRDGRPFPSMELTW